MSQYEHRMELWNTEQETIDLAKNDLAALAIALEGRSPGDRVATLASFAEEFAFDIEKSIAGVESAIIARSQHFDAEQMRKGLRHGSVAIVATADTDQPIDLVAAAAAAIGLAATLVKMFGEISLIVVERESDLLDLAQADIFSLPDCVMTFRASAGGYGFQHTITSSGNNLAGVTLSIEFEGGSGIELRELHSTVGTLIDNLGESETLSPTSGGFEITAPLSSRVQEILSQISALARTRANSAGSRVEIHSAEMLVEMLPSRILARRVKTFADTLKVKQDRIQKQPVGEPTRWGTVSHEVATAIVSFPITDDGVDEPGDIDQAMAIAKCGAGAGLDILGDMEFRGFVEGERIRALRERDIARTPRRWLGVHPVLPPTSSERQPVNLPDVIVRGPGLPEPTLDDFVDDDESS